MTTMTEAAAATEVGVVAKVEVAAGSGRWGRGKFQTRECGLGRHSGQDLENGPRTV